MLSVSGGVLLSVEMMPLFYLLQRRLQSLQPIHPIDGVHFPKDFPPQNVASRALRVNISDFAAMGVKPTAMTMALSLPSSDPQWLAEF